MWQIGQDCLTLHLAAMHYKKLEKGCVLMNIMCLLCAASILVGSKNRVTQSLLPQKSVVFVRNHAGQGSVAVPKHKSAP
jgi:hypothetical protein